jgi:hypothetical protein
MRVARLGALCLGLLYCTHPPASAQSQEDLPEWKIDPYTENDAERLEAAGYVKYHRFMITEDLGTTEVMKVLGDLKMIWVETAHFKIGSTLPKYRIPGDRIQRENIARELDELRELFPDIPKKVRTLDPWLRVHLYAQRLEKEYAAIQELLGVSDASFPAGRNSLVKGQYMGEGPYLGQRNKFIVLLTKRKSTLHRFASRWCEGNFRADSPISHNFIAQGCMLYGTAGELAEGYLGDDSRMYANLAFGICNTMLLGYKGYMFDLPLWLREGIGHCYVNEIDARYHNFSGIRDAHPNDKKLWIWAPRVRKLVKNEATIPMDQIMSWTKPDDFRIGHHLNIWSRVHYLKQLDSEKFQTFVARMSDKFDLPADSNGMVSPEMVLARQAEVFAMVYGMTPTEFDQQWQEWVLDTYPKK